MTERYVFAVYTGRSGGMQTTAFLNRNVHNCWAANEYPSYEPTLPGRLGSWQRRFHRRFIETHELLGRGKVLTAFVEGDHDYIERVARKRFRRIEKEMERRGADIFIDVTKFFARGLHCGVNRLIPRYSLLLIVRDPIKNMRSFLNRNKNFDLDNNRPGDACNVLRLDESDMEKGELYLWMWCELYLRFQELAKLPNVDRATVMRTEDMNRPERWAATLDELDLPHGEITIEPPENTNVRLGYGRTTVTEGDARLFERFLGRLPAELRGRIDYFDAYDPWAAVGPAR